MYDRMSYVRRILVFMMMILVAASSFDADARRRRKKRARKRAKVTKVVMKTPTASGPLTETEPFVVYDRERPITRGLDNKNIALWQSHGRYFDQKTGTWRWQRPRLFGTCEDLLSAGFVLPYLTPMLENAGAYVMLPRERDLSTTEIIIDTDGSPEGDFYLMQGAQEWIEGATGSGFAMPARALQQEDNPFVMGTSEQVATIAVDDDNIEESRACWSATFPQRGRYALYVSYAASENNAPDARYTVNHLGGSTEIQVNQQMGASTWVYLGTFDFAAGKQSRPVVELSNRSDFEDTVVSADAVKIGGGMGNVARGGESTLWNTLTSGMPRYAEGARYWLQWAGMPVEVYSESRGENDYTDDYKSRALWVNYLAGGSPMLPDSAGLKVPVDLALAFHTDAGTRDDGTVVGTLGIYSTDSGELLGDGRSRTACGDLCSSITRQVVADLSALHHPGWGDRGNRDGKYYEIRQTKVPAMILELLSHQNFTDMKFGLDPRFRFDVARAVYKGVLRFLSARYNKPYTVQPLPPVRFAIDATRRNHYRLSWAPQPDALEPTAVAKYYIVEERVDNGAFRPVAYIDHPHWEVEVTDDAIHSYRIVAGNDGGVSFPSEVLALYNSGSLPQVSIVNGFTRVSAPDDFTEGGFGGFAHFSDGGVADGLDFIATGPQYDYRESSVYVSDDAPGFGASRGVAERSVSAGNTRDFVYLHGRAVKAAGFGFVSSGADAFASGNSGAMTPAIVDLILGKQKEIRPGVGSYGTRYKCFTPAMQQRLEEYCSAGGSLLVSGSYVATDLLANPFSDEITAYNDSLFAANLLGVGLQFDRGSIDGIVETVYSPFRPFSAPTQFSFKVKADLDGYAVESPDAVSPASVGTSTIMRYRETGMSAAVASERTRVNGPQTAVSRVAVLGFPFETIVSEKSRHEVMADLLGFLSGDKKKK